MLVFAVIAGNEIGVALSAVMIAIGLDLIAVHLRISSVDSAVKTLKERLEIEVLYEKIKNYVCERLEKERRLRCAT